MNTVSRRTLSKAALSLGAGGFAIGRFAGIAAQESTPGSGGATPIPEIQPLGYASLRVRQLADAAFRPEVNDIVRADFVPTVQALDGYAGYLLGDIIENDTQSLSLVVLDQHSQVDGFVTAAQEFVGSLDPKYAVATPTSAEGDVLIAATAASTSATPEATPVVEGEVPGGGYVAVRIYTSLPGSDPREIAPLALTSFVPIVQGLPGFQGYLFFPSEGGFTSISLYDSERAAEESTAAAANWATANLANYADGKPQVINAGIVFADLPILPSVG